MTSGTISATPQGIATGGGIALTMAVAGTAGSEGIVIQRSKDGGNTWVQIYSGPFISYFLDIGEGLPTTLQTTLSYMYTVYDVMNPNIKVVTIGVTPSSMLTLIPDMTTELWRRLLTTALASLSLPKGIKAPQFLLQLPLDATPSLPFVTMNLDLCQQQELPIGFSLGNDVTENTDTSTVTWNLSGLQRRVYSVYVMARTYQERDFFEEALVGILFGLQGVLKNVNQQLKFSYQLTQGALIDDSSGPGLYYSQIQITTTSISQTEIQAKYGGIIEHALPDVQD